ncbi:hypothetical protein [Saccharicrinis fermentans]|uniref:Uncharacterized protein n=1 Tax=Saccharicrinis fermentans DSM 9555 = JCM 21142 TaxID=869213 RepID=W7YL56_9BACT|nr:hypothetical protein [Saccharicrinis fermentans]GAF05276.1 hypothetical protein JCM21142_94003 [Saccharicrinis fermentans DSM 9555 = JCM 21142]
MTFVGVLLGMLSRVALEQGILEGYTIANLDAEMGLPVLLIISGCKKTTVFSVFDKKASKTRPSIFLKIRSLLIVNDCFKNENNAVFGVFLQRLITKIDLPLELDANIYGILLSLITYFLVNTIMPAYERLRGK